jgi:DNA-directed RNA polymerase subunit N|tara:strand:- start:63 stop:314 length:252 start_codon:yes stop_codon:yes gene_type:complete
MIIPIRCFTCGKVIAHLYEDYRNKLQEHVKEDDSSSTYATNDVYSSEKTFEGKLLDELGIERYCCRRMFLTQNDTCKIISHIL